MPPRKTARASAEVKAGDRIDILFGEKTVSVRVLNVQETVRKEEASSTYEYV